MKATFVLTTAVLLLAQTIALRFSDIPLTKTAKKDHVTYITTADSNVGADFCKGCVSFAGQAIDQLLNIILNGGVIGTCGTLCGDLAQKTGSQALGAVCTLLCDAVGIKEFIDILNKADIDPIYYCEELKTCPIFDTGDAKITDFTVTPKSGPQGEFDLQFVYMSKNGTGTGEIDVAIETVDGIPVGEAFLHEVAAAGTYSTSFKLQAKPDPSCDPSQQPCEEWLPGDYTAKIAICNGECGSKHPHSQVYDQAEATFTITQ